MKFQEEPGSVQETIPAHKLILASVSEVFATMFFGNMKEEGDVVELKGTTTAAAKAFFNIIYKKPGEVDMDKLSFSTIFHVYKLADR